jgi:hypothetical protein
MTMRENKVRPEVTTILSGGRGVPTIVVREPGWQQQAAAEREAQRRAETDAEVKRIERDREIREHSPRPRPGVVEQALADWKSEKWLRDCEEKRNAPAKAAADLAELEAWAASPEVQEYVASKADPPMRYGRPVSTAQLNYEAQQAAWQAKQSRPAGGGCGYCNTCRDGGPQWCLHG